MTTFTNIDDKLKATAQKLRESYNTIRENRKKTILLDHRAIIEKANDLAISKRTKANPVTKSKPKKSEHVPIPPKHTQNKVIATQKPSERMLISKSTDIKQDMKEPKQKQPKQPKQPKTCTHEICKATTMAGNKCKAKAVKDGLCGRHMKK